jgi:chromate transporter
MTATARPGAAATGRAAEVFLVFLRLGLTSFGGPIAHLGYFRAEFVQRRAWLTEPEYASLVGLCQFLPGPASSQVGFSIGLRRAGWRGGLAAWVGFTTPSALALIAVARLAGAFGQSPAGEGLLHGLKLAAVAVVAQAVWSMARTLCPDRPRASIAALAAAGALLAPTSAAQVFIIIAGGLAGVIFTDGVAGAAPPVGDNTIVSRRAGLVCLAAFAILLALSCVGGLPGLFGACYRAGALVFGGGHVVLPLLRDALVRPGYVSDAAFLAGYGAAQAVPGPLFTVAAYLGTVSAGVAGGLAALAGIFLPGLLIVAGALPFWQAAQGLAKAQAAMAGVNAAVVGLLGAAFYSPIVTGAVRGPADAAVALGGFVLLVAWRAPPWLVVALCAAAGLAIVAAGPVG